MNGNDLFNLVYNETTGEFESYADQGYSKAKEFLNWKQDLMMMTIISIMNICLRRK